MSHAHNSLSVNEATDMILTMGDTVSFLLVGHMGFGKTTSGRVIAEVLKETHRLCYFNCTTKVDGSDLTLPKFKDLDTADYVSYVPNEELGLHLSDRKPILMLDEIGKNPNLLPPLTEVLQERSLNGKKFLDGNIVFATTNYGSENVGDGFKAHENDRITQLPIRKPTPMEWVVWGINNNIDPALLGFAKETPAIFADYRDIDDPRENQYIFHPGAPERSSFVTGRSLERASKIISRARQSDSITDDMVKIALINTIGVRGALDLNAYLKLADKMPRMADIKATPDKAIVPDNITALCMVVFNALSAVESDWVTQWMEYLVRLPKEAQHMFVNGVTDKKFDPMKQAKFFRNKAFSKWILDNKHIFTARQ